jgi:C4-dicarboxylate transporter
MKKRTERFYVLLPVVLTIGLYTVFYDKIACKPNHAGFWLILVLGMSIGVALTRFIQWPRIE